MPSEKPVAAFWIKALAIDIDDRAVIAALRPVFRFRACARIDGIRLQSGYMGRHKDKGLTG